MPKRSRNGTSTAGVFVELANRDLKWTPKQLIHLAERKLNVTLAFFSKIISVWSVNIMDIQA